MEKSYSKEYEGTYSVSCKSVHFRIGPGISYKNLKVLCKGDTVSCNGFFVKSGTSEWLNGTAIIKGEAINGWISAKYLKKI